MHNYGAAVLEQWLYPTNKMEKTLVLEQGNYVLISSFCIISVCTGFRSTVFVELPLSKRDLEKAVLIWGFSKILLSCFLRCTKPHLGELTRQFDIRKQVDQDVPKSCLPNVAKPALQVLTFLFSKC